VAYWYRGGRGWLWNADPKAQPTDLYGYSYEAVTDPNQMPPNYKPPPQPPPPPAPADVKIPVVEYRANWLPTYDGLGGFWYGADIHFWPEDDSGSTGDFAPPAVVPYHVLLSSFRSADTAITAKLKDAINGTDGYTDLKTYLDRVKEWVYYRPEHNPLKPASLCTNPIDPGAVLTEDQKHAPPSQDALDAVKYLDNAVAATGDALLTVGMYLERLFEAAEIYVKADRDSFFPTE
jgi:hypothetical protein